VAEELRLEERIGDGRAVDCDERARPAAAVVVERPGEALLAGTGLSFDERGEIGVGGSVELGERATERRASSDDVGVVTRLLAARNECRRDERIRDRRLGPPVSGKLSPPPRSGVRASLVLGA
jgi:hypothetical protein